MSEIVSKRTKTSRTFDLGGGKYRVESGPIFHTFKNSAWVPVDTSISVEEGTDVVTGEKYSAKTAGDFLDFDIKFKKDSPLSVTLGYIPKNKTITFSPVGENKKPNVLVTGQKMHVDQAWDGIDVDLFVTSSGIKTNYIITSAYGQKVIQFDVKGDVPSFHISRPWYITPTHQFPIFVPTNFDGETLQYDFTHVPVGTTVDPSVTAVDGTAQWIQANNSSWATVRSASSGSVQNNYYIVYSEYYPGDGNYYLYRSFPTFDCSSVSGVVNSATFKITLSTAVQNVGELVIFQGTQASPLTSNDYDNFNYGELGYIAVSGWSVGQTKSFSIDPSSINVGGTTKLCMSSSYDSDNSAPPSTPSGILIYSQDVAIDIVYDEGQPRMGRSAHLRRSAFGPMTF